MIKIFPTIQIKELDAYTIENEPVASIDLMERASQALAKTISERWNTETPFTVFAGPGNNGGDALAVSRLLAQQGYRVEVYLFNTKGSLSPDCETNKKRLTELSGIDFHEITTQFVPPELTARHVVLDGLFGSGLNKPLSGGFAAVVKYINSSPATVVALDVPSGLMGEDNTYNIQANIIRADFSAYKFIYCPNKRISVIRFESVKRVQSIKFDYTSIYFGNFRFHICYIHLCNITRFRLFRNLQAQSTVIAVI